MKAIVIDSEMPFNDAIREYRQNTARETVNRHSLGTDQIIRPGAINLMTAGKGIVHSERMDDAYKRRGAELFGLQTGLALPDDKEEVEPAFHHHEKRELPVIEDGKAQPRLVVDSAWGERAPVPTYLDALFADVNLEPDAQIPIGAEHVEPTISPPEPISPGRKPPAFGCDRRKTKYSGRTQRRYQVLRCPSGRRSWANRCLGGIGAVSLIARSRQAAEMLS